MTGQFSCFAPFGVFRFSSAESPCAQHYSQLKSNLGDGLQGPVQDAITYGLAMALGVQEVQARGAAAQKDPLQATVTIPDLEKDHRIYPTPGQSIAERRNKIAQVASIGAGGDAAAIEAGLVEILGDRLVDVMRLDLDTEVTVYPDNAPVIDPVTTPIRLITITERIFPGTRTFHWETLFTDGNPIIVGDVLIVDPGEFGLEERVTITASNSLTLTGVFAKTHEPGTMARTGHWPHWCSTKRHTIIIVDADVLENPELLANVEWFMRRRATGVSTWVVTTGTVDAPTVFSVGGIIGHSVIG